MPIINFVEYLAKKKSLTTQEAKYLLSQLELTPVLKKLARTIHSQNGLLYLSSGMVRDILMHFIHGAPFAIFDIDLVSIIEFDNIKALHLSPISEKKSLYQFIESGEQYEIKILIKKSASSQTIEERLEKSAINRDITFNALYIEIDADGNIVWEKLYDFFGGVYDVERLLIKMITSPRQTFGQTLSLDSSKKDYRFMRIFNIFNCLARWKNHPWPDGKVLQTSRAVSIVIQQMKDYLTKDYKNTHLLKKNLYKLFSRYYRQSSLEELERHGYAALIFDNYDFIRNELYEILNAISTQEIQIKNPIDLFTFIFWPSFEYYILSNNIQILDSAIEDFLTKLSKKITLHPPEKNQLRTLWGNWIREDARFSETRKDNNALPINSSSIAIETPAIPAVNPLPSKTQNADILTQNLPKEQSENNNTPSNNSNPTAIEKKTRKKAPSKKNSSSITSNNSKKQNDESKEAEIFIDEYQDPDSIMKEFPTLIVWKGKTIDIRGNSPENTTNTHKTNKSSTHFFPQKPRTSDKANKNIQQKTNKKHEDLENSDQPTKRIFPFLSWFYKKYEETSENKDALIRENQIKQSKNQARIGDRVRRIIEEQNNPKPKKSPSSFDSPILSEAAFHKKPKKQLTSSESELLNILKQLKDRVMQHKKRLANRDRNKQLAIQDDPLNELFSPVASYFRPFYFWIIAVLVSFTAATQHRNKEIDKEFLLFEAFALFLIISMLDNSAAYIKNEFTLNQWSQLKNQLVTCKANSHSLKLHSIVDKALKVISNETQRGVQRSIEQMEVDIKALEKLIQELDPATCQTAKLAF